MTRPVHTCTLEAGLIAVAEYSMLFSAFIFGWCWVFQSYNEGAGEFRTASCGKNKMPCRRLSKKSARSERQSTRLGSDCVSRSSAEALGKSTALTPQSLCRLLPCRHARAEAVFRLFLSNLIAFERYGRYFLINERSNGMNSPVDRAGRVCFSAMVKGIIAAEAYVIVSITCFLLPNIEYNSGTAFFQILR
jgi:hypothetical protein